VNIKGAKVSSPGSVASKTECKVSDRDSLNRSSIVSGCELHVNTSIEEDVQVKQTSKQYHMKSMAPSSCQTPIVEIDESCANLISKIKMI
jgi:hypothetical protein